MFNKQLLKRPTYDVFYFYILEESSDDEAYSDDEGIEKDHEDSKGIILTCTMQ
jgi:hypothetical protein